MLGRKRILGGALALGLLAGACGAQANPYETVLPNGFKVIVKEDARAPSVVHMIWYRVGAMDEVDGHSGVAHVLEHMMFKGTPKVGPGEFSRKVAAVGGRENAFTSYDYTAYFQQVPPKRLDEMMRIEADRMDHLVFDGEAFEKELAVVKEERRMRTDDQPRALVFEQLMATAFQSNSYRRPVIGWMNDLDAMRAADARAWYRQWYEPSNAYMVVVGDVKHEAVFKEAAATFGKIPAVQLPERRTIVEPAQHGTRRVEVKAPAELPYLALGWHVPTLKDPLKDRDAFALEVLSAVLDGYEGARLNADLVRGSRKAVSAGAGYDSMSRGPALFMLDAVPSEGVGVADLEKALKEEIARIQKDGISPEELARVKAQAVAGQVYKRDSLMGQAMEIGALESAGLSWRDEDVLLAGLRAVTAEEVQAVAKRYFSDDNLTVATLIPLPVSAKGPRPAVDLQHLR